MSKTNRLEVGIMNSSRARSTQATAGGGDLGAPQGAPAPAGGRGGAGADGAATAGQRPGRSRGARSPWAVLCAVAAVVLGPAATTASALEQANRAPLHHAVRIDPAPAYIPADSTRRKPAA
ncbi:hypothetical protein ACWC9X_00110 [Streptomyces asoensis]|uniref:hypothetical protein n=1 Tax=Streptomyces sp. MBT49 TaxID=1488380 RepID=UPI00190CC15E|nr:hypothetical protein [Streptomyces sp. MBT49]MBK3629177.1 hypothetical protein [Streptomyces sp. MBT49]